MAEFCKQCSIEVWGEDTKDFVNASEEPLAVLCEGCGYAIVQSDGTCIATDCLKKHGAKSDARQS